MGASPIEMGCFKKKNITGDGCKILNVQCSLGQLADSPNIPGRSPEKYPFDLELSGSIRL